MTKIVIGESGKTHVAIDRKVMMSTRLLVTSDSGGGKTWLLKRLIEQSFGQVGIIIIDPEGEFSPLRTKYDFFLVGKGGDVPADIRTAEKVALTLLQGRASAVCDIYEMKDSERHIWVQRFLDALLNAPKQLRAPYFVIVDEAHMFCPEHGKGESVASDAMRGLATRGRKRMLCGMYATQRLATLSKDLTGMCLNRLVGPTFEYPNQVVAADQLGIPKNKGERQPFFDQIKMLEPGNFYALGRAITRELKLVHVGEIETPHGQDALKYELKPPPPPERVREWLAKIGDLPKAAEEEAKTTAEFKKQIADLKKELRSGRAISAAAPPIVKEKTVADQRYLSLIGDAMKIIVKLQAIGFEASEPTEREMKAVVAEIRKIANAQLKTRGHELDSLKSEARTLLARMERLTSKEPIHVTVETHKLPAREIQPQGGRTLKLFGDDRSRNENENSKRTTHPRPETYDGDLPDGERKILTAVAQHVDGVDRQQLTILTGYKRSTRDAYISRMIPKGLIDVERNGIITVTPLGQKELGENFEPLPTGVELQEHWLRELPDGESKVFALLLQAGGQPVNRDDITEATGYKRSTRDAYLSRMAARHIVEPLARGEVRAAAKLFE